MMQGRAFSWQNPIIAAMSALQPGLVEEVVYRFTFLGMVWWFLRDSFPRRAVLLASFFSVVVHSYAHLDDLFVNNPIFAVVYGAALGIIFGLPMVVLAVRRDLESAIGFHWMQDFVRFFAGF